MSMAADLTPEQREAFADALYSGRKIEAIKQLRELSGLGLKESKDIIDRLETELRAAHPEKFAPARKDGAGCILVLVLLAAAVGLFFWILFHPITT